MKNDKKNQNKLLKYFSILILGIILAVSVAWIIPHFFGKAARASKNADQQNKISFQSQGQGKSKSENESKSETKTFYHCAMHPHYISEKPGTCPICGMELVPFKFDENNNDGNKLNKIHIDASVIQNMGVQTLLVNKQVMNIEIRMNGKVKVDESRISLVTARVMGYVEKLPVNTLGQRVEKGQALLELYSPDFSATEEEFLQALGNMQATPIEKVGNEPASDGTKTGSQEKERMESVKQRLLNWGMAREDLKQIEMEGKGLKNLRLYSPSAGVVLEKNILLGQNIMAGTELFRIADLSKVWVVADLYPKDLASVKVGADVDIDLAYLPGKVFRGKVHFISPTVNAENQSAQVRIEVTNTKAFDLKPETFATVRIHAAKKLPVIAIPDQAIVRSGRRNLVILALGGGYFEPREIVLGASDGSQIEVVSGLEEGDKIVVSSQFMIDSESNLKSAIQQMSSVGNGSTDSSQGK